jgi:hypothetical protein
MISLFTLLDISPYVLCLPATIICTLQIFSLCIVSACNSLSPTHTQATRVSFDDVGWDELREVLIPFVPSSMIPMTLCLLSCGILSERRCMQRLQCYLGERPEGRTGLRVVLVCEVI